MPKQRYLSDFIIYYYIVTVNLHKYRKYTENFLEQKTVYDGLFDFAKLLWYNYVNPIMQIINYERGSLS